MSNDFRPCAVITGASDGIGAELARVFAAKGHRLALVARRKERMEALADEIAGAGHIRPTVIALDLEQADAADRLSEALEREGLEVQYLVNNAGFGLLGAAAELDRREQLAMIDLNVRSLTNLTLYFMPDIVSLKGGVMNVASVASFMPGPGLAIYYASKAFVRSFTEALWEETKGAGIKVCCLCPGPVETGFQARSGFHFEGLMGMLKPARLSATEVARQAYDGMFAGARVIVPGVVNKFIVWCSFAAPNAVLMRVLAMAQKPRKSRLAVDAAYEVPVTQNSPSR